jgi:hypothetical protein
MDVRLTERFDERCRAVDPAFAATHEARSLLLVSSKGTAVEKGVLDNWAKGSFETPMRSLEYHFGKHGSGRTRQQYTFDALQFFRENKDRAQWGKWRNDWNEAFRLKIGNRCGYFTPSGRVISFWEIHEARQATL